MSKRKGNDAKTDALRASRTLHPHPEAVTDEAFVSEEFFDARDVVQVKYEMLRRVNEEGTSVSSAAAAFGFSRQSYYQAAAALQTGGLPALVPAKPGPRGAFLGSAYQRNDSGCFRDLEWVRLWCAGGGGLLGGVRRRCRRSRCRRS